MKQDARASAGALAYRPDIDGLRAISVVVVVLFHLGLGILPGGFVGVDVFFVISGYLITSIIARESNDGRFSFGLFYERRIRRIYPAMMAMLFATFVGCYLVLMPREFGLFGRTLIWAPLFSSNFAFLGSVGYFDAAGITRPLLHTWSLGVEEQFYIVFPWLLIGAQRFGWNRLKLVGGTVVVSLASSVVSGCLGFDQAYFLLPMRFWELGFGALLALHQTRITSFALRNLIGPIGLAMIFFACVVLDEAMPFPGWMALLPVIGACGVLVAEGSPTNRLIASAPFVFIGRISYPMYLWHWPLIVFTISVTGRPIDPFQAVILFGLTIGLSWASLVVLEQPIRTRRWLPARGRLFGVSAALSAVLVVVGLVAFNSRGMPWRLSPAERALADISTELPEVDILCPGSRRGVAKDLPPCVLGDVKAEHYSFALLGDSHSRVMAASIGDVAAKAGVKGLYLGRIACPPLIGLDRRDEPNRHCAEHLLWALERIRAENIDNVFVVARWGILIPPAQFGNERIADIVFTKGGKTVPEAEERQVVKDALVATLDALTGRRLTVLFSIPEAGYDVPMVQAAAKRFGWQPPVGSDRSLYERRQKKIRDLFAEVLLGRDGIEVLEPANVLCGRGDCLLMKDGKLLYSDDDHVSRAGGALLAPLFEPALRRSTMARR